MTCVLTVYWTPLSAFITGDLSSMFLSLTVSLSFDGPLLLLPLLVPEVTVWPLNVVSELTESHSFKYHPYFNEIQNTMRKYVGVCVCVCACVCVCVCVCVLNTPYLTWISGEQESWTLTVSKYPSALPTVSSHLKWHLHVAYSQILRVTFNSA